MSHDQNRNTLKIDSDIFGDGREDIKYAVRQVFGSIELFQKTIDDNPDDYADKLNEIANDVAASKKLVLR